MLSRSFPRLLWRQSYAAHASARKFLGHMMMIPHPDKIAKGGEDAAFVTKRSMAVADGVGGWQRVGVDPGLYSRSLLHNLEEEVEEGDLEHPKELLHRAYERNKSITGSCTCCFVTLQNKADSSCIVSVCNLGDSGTLVYRPSNNKIIFKSEEQVHDFNFPMQLGTNSEDSPEHADLHELVVEEGDLVLTATDGIFDNLFDEHIVELISNERLNIEERCEQLAKTAYIHSLDPAYVSPFAMREKEWVVSMSKGQRPRSYMKNFVGGKADDITCVLAQVAHDPNPECDET